MNDDEFIKTTELFTEYLEQMNSIDWFNDTELFVLIDRLKSLNNHDLIIRIFKQLLILSLEITSEPRSYDDIEYTHYDFQEKLKLIGSLGQYHYKRFLNKAQEYFHNTDNEIGFFCLLCDCYENLYKDIDINLEIKENYDNHIQYQRSAIEQHSQDGYKQNKPDYILVSAIRDCAERIINMGNNEQISIVFNILKKNNRPLFTRIILHLLRTTSHYDKQLLESYLTDSEIIGNIDYHHEYFLLTKDKFDTLSEESKNKIWEYIDTGPAEDWGREEERVKSWKYRLLNPIRAFAPAYITKKYKSIIESIDKGKDNEEHHPDFLRYIYGSFRGTLSPIEGSEFSAMDAEQIVEYLKKWKPKENGWRTPEIRGLANTLQTDVENNPGKYLDNINLFTEITEPTYINHLLYGLLGVDKTEVDWVNILTFLQWAIQQDSQSYNRDGVDGDKNWHWTRQEVARLISNFYEHSDLKIRNNDFINTSFNILNTIASEKDEFLDEKDDSPHTLRGHHEYFDSAINSKHGVALEGLIQFLLWQNKRKLDVSEVLKSFDNLLDTGTCPETWAVFGRFFPWIHFNNPEWAKKKVDLIYPESDKIKFEAAFYSLIEYTNPFDDMFVLLKDKYKYAISEMDIESEQKRTDFRIFEHVAVFYARGKLKLNSDIFDLIFNDIKYADAVAAIMRFIGFLLKDENANVSNTIMKRFANLWDWWLKKIKGDETIYKQALENFSEWFASNKFEQEWAVKHFHNVVVNLNIDVESYFLGDSLLKHLPKNPKLIFEIVEKLSLKADMFKGTFEDSIIEETIKYITENSTDSGLRNQAKIFINEFLKTRQFDMQKWSDKLTPYHNKL
jgi:hypothetical protein